MIVVDASVWISVLMRNDFFHQQSYAWFAAYSTTKNGIAAPSLLLAEVAGGIARRTDDARMGKASLQYLMGLEDVKIVSIDPELAQTAAELAADCRLRGADAIYVAVAYTLKVPLLSWDQEQLARVQQVVKAGVPGSVF